MFSNFSNQDITGKAKRMARNWLEANQKRWKRWPNSNLSKEVEIPSLEVKRKKKNNNKERDTG